MTEDELKDKLEKLAAREVWCDQEDFSPDDYSGGNYDDAYSGGYDDGQAKLAKELIGLLFKPTAA